MKTLIRVSVALSTLMLATIGVAHAQTQTFTGETYDVATTFNRPIDNGSSAPDTLSSIGTNDYYSVQAFTVPVTGSYDILSTTDNSSVWDNFAVLYQNAFSASTPLTNALFANDDYNLTTGVAGFSAVPLTTGTTYYLVTSGFDDSDQGAFTDTISPVAGAASPEPGAAALLLAGMLPGVGAAGRKAARRPAARLR